MKSSLHSLGAKTAPGALEELLLSQSCVHLFVTMNYSTPGFRVLYYLPEFAQTHAHRVSGAIQPFHPPSPSSPPALKLSQNLGLSNELAHLRGGGYKMQEPRGVPKNRTFFFLRRIVLFI